MVVVVVVVVGWRAGETLLLSHSCSVITQHRPTDRQRESWLQQQCAWGIRRDPIRSKASE